MTDKWRLLTAAEACPILGYKSPKALRLAAQQGLIPRVVIGKRVLFDPEKLREWAAKGGTPRKAEDRGETRDQEVVSQVTA